MTTRISKGNLLFNHLSVYSSDTVPAMTVGRNGDLAIIDNGSEGVEPTSVGLWVKIPLTDRRAPQGTVINGTPGSISTLSSITINGVTVDLDNPTNIQYIISDINSAYITDIQAQFVGGTIQIINSAGGPITVGRNSLGLISSAALADLNTTGVWMPFNTASTPSVSYRNLQFFVENPTPRSYPLLQSAGFSFTINNLVAVTDAGSLNVTIMINSTPVGGLNEIQITDVQTTFLATGDNIVLVGDTVTIVLDSISNVNDLSVTLAYSFAE